jgi:hypothetical protein
MIVIRGQAYIIKLINTYINMKLWKKRRPYGRQKKERLYKILFFCYGFLPQNIREGISFGLERRKQQPGSTGMFRVPPAAGIEVNMENSKVTL